MAASATSTAPMNSYPRIPPSPSPSQSPLSSPTVPRSSAYRRSSSISSTTSTTSSSPFPHSTPTTSQYSPSKPKPPPLHNAHPYAIKTTSTALLTRSTSSTTMSDAAVNHYIPPSSPSPSPSPNSPGGSGFAYGFGYGSGSEGDERDGSPTAKRRGHRYSRSLTSDLPMPLPPPPGSAAVKGLSAIGPSYSTPGFESPYRQSRQPRSPSPSPSGSRGRNQPRHALSEGEAEQEDDDDTPRRRLYYQQQQDQFSRGMGLAAPAFPEVHNHNGALPDDPKAWTPAQLAQYLLTTSSADLHGNDTIAKFVKEKQISGRAFLRLADADLDSLSSATRAALLNTSRTLRQSLVRARILSSTSDSNPPKHQLPPSTNVYSSSGSPLDGEHKPGSSTTSSVGAMNSDNDGFNPDFQFGGASSGTTSTSPLIPIGTLSRSRGVRPRRRDGVNGSRGSVDSMSGASDSGSSISSSSSHSHTRTRTLSAARDISASAKKRVRERVDELEERISISAGSGVEEEGSASSSSSGVGRERGGSPVKRVQAVPVSADGTKAKAKALPQRGGVVNLFEEGQRRGHDEPIKQRQPLDKEEEDKDSTIVGLARKNVNGREPRLLPFPPAPPPSHVHHHPHQHIQAQQTHTPISSAGVEDYEFGFRRTYGAMHGDAQVTDHGAHSNGAMADPFGSVYVVRHSPRPASVAHQPTDAGSPLSAGGSPARAASAAASSMAGSGGRPPRLLPFPPVVGHAVLHHPVPKRAVGVGVESATSDTGNEVWESALEDQEWAREVVQHEIGTLEDAKGILDQKIEKKIEKRKEEKEELDERIKLTKGAFKETQTGTDEADEEEEMSVQQLLLRGDPGVPKISGVEAWEMELGETVKRIGANTSVSANGKDVEIGRKAGGGSKRHNHTGKSEMKTKGRAELAGSQAQRGGLMGLFADDSEGAGVTPASTSSIPEKPTEEVDAENKARAERAEADNKQREEKTAELNAREMALDEREREVRDRLASVEERERKVTIREEEVGKREVDIGKREDSVGKSEEALVQREVSIQTLEAGVKTREGELERLEKEARERETRVGVREVEADSVWRDFEKREQDLKEYESNVQEKLAEVEKREQELKELEGVLHRGKEDLERREREVTQREIDAFEREEKEKKRPTTMEKTIQAVQESSDKCVETVPKAQQIHSAACPKPYLVSSWMLKRDYFLGRFIGAFADLGDNYTSERGGGMLANIRGGGGALVLMGIGVCAVVLRVLGRRIAGVAGVRT
ncbi:hypothetical protein JR316_0006512 [Psilocybe cubensis]|uniref:Uncharacterized protein n=2 Tax=Psilocybe cubensis TaxID=181762 RepID=A0ACB8H2V1_PSICU|nr:hypothetical protein JR316_0006512 [Psilocybe cubensis]KAH9481982.1 hypothetical protein JR316_0006512 [Psilocybe cubensis]